MIPCRKILQALSDYLDDDLAVSVRRDLEAHLADCKTCRVIYDTSRRTLRILTDVSSFEIPGEIGERLLRKTMGEIEARQSRSDADRAPADEDGRSDKS